jgi:LPXTG-motif cell wall-anchored protein
VSYEYLNVAKDPTVNKNTITVTTIASNCDVFCTNATKSYALPKTGGSGTQRYTWCGLTLMALAAGGTAYGNRRRRRARKGASAR